MKVSLPEGYVPPQPTHPYYGYLTPQEREEYEAQERERLGIVPAVEEPGSSATEAAVEAEAEPESGGSTWAPPPASPASPATSVPPPAVEETQRWQPSWSEPAPAERAELAPAERAGQPRGGWVPSGPPVVAVQAEAEPVARRSGEATSVLGQIGEYRWDAYRQEWVSEPRLAARSAEPSAPARAESEEPPPDVAAAAGGRGASSSWVSADGQRFRWDARAQRWVVEGA